ncbi:MAG: hypothetical protein AAF196_08775 [Planctomycetota bacterium]
MMSSCIAARRLSTVLLCLTVTALAGCGGEEDPKGGAEGPSVTQRRGETRSPAGEWRVHVDETLAANGRILPAIVPQQLRDGLSKMRLILADDGTTRMEVPSRDPDDPEPSAIEGWWTYELTLDISWGAGTGIPDAVRYSPAREGGRTADRIIVVGEQNGFLITTRFKRSSDG